MPSPPRNSKALDPESISRSKLPRSSKVRCSWKLPQVDSHQSSQDATLHTPESIVSKEETCERDREMERFCDSLTFSRVIEARSGGTVYGPGKEGRKSYSTSDVGDREQEGIRVWSGPPQNWKEPS